MGVDALSIPLYSSWHPRGSPVLKKSGKAMIEAFINALVLFPRGLVYVGLGLVLLLLAKLANDLITHHSIDEEVVGKRNMAIALGLSGYFAAVILVFVGAVFQPLTLAVNEGLGFNREFGAE